eukprot:515339_1
MFLSETYFQNKVCGLCGSFNGNYFQNKVCGLCGSFNGNVNDELLGSNGIQYLPPDITTISYSFMHTETVYLSFHADSIVNDFSSTYAYPTLSPTSTPTKSPLTSAPTKSPFCTNKIT